MPDQNYDQVDSITGKAFNGNWNALIVSALFVVVVFVIVVF